MLGLGDIVQEDCISQRGDVMLKAIEDTVYPKPFKEVCIYINWQHLALNLSVLASFVKEVRVLGLELMLKISPYFADGTMLDTKAKVKEVLGLIEGFGFKPNWFKKIEINEPFNEKGITGTALVENDAILVCKAVIEAKPDKWQFVLSSQNRGGFWDTYHNVFLEFLWDWHLYNKPKVPERLMTDLGYLYDARQLAPITCSECNIMMPNAYNYANYFTQENMFALGNVIMSTYWAIGETCIYPWWSNQWGAFSAISDNPILTLLTRGTKKFVQLVKTLPEE